MSSEITVLPLLYLLATIGFLWVAYDLWKMPKVSIKSNAIGPAHVKTKFVRSSPTIYHGSGSDGFQIALNGNTNDKYVCISFSDGDRELVKPHLYVGAFGDVPMIHHALGHYSDKEHEKTDQKYPIIALLMFSAFIALCAFTVSIKN